MKNRTKILTLAVLTVLMLATVFTVVLASSTVTVSFYDGGKLVGDVSVAEGGVPTAPDADEIVVIDGVGYRLLGWSTTEGAVELGNNETDCLCSAGGVRNDVLSTCASTAEVTLALGTVEDHLVTGVSVNGGHDTALDGSVIVESLSHGSKAVGGAGCSGDDLVISGEGFVVYVVNDGG